MRHFLFSPFLHLLLCHPCHPVPLTPSSSSFFFLGSCLPHVQDWAVCTSPCPHLSAEPIAFLLHFSRSPGPSTAHIIRIASFLGFRQATEASSWPCCATPLGLQLTIAATTNSYLVHGVLSAQGYCSPGVSLPLNLASGLFSLQYRNCIHQGWFVLSLPTHSSSLRVLLCFTSQ